MTTAMSMRALQLVAPGTLQEVTRPIPNLASNEVLVQTVVTTICTSDLSDIHHNPFGIVLPRVLGHEGAGLVRAVGRDVSNFCPGDRVTAHPVIPCGRCENCQRQLDHLCCQMGHLGLDRDGTFAEYFAIRADRVRRLPDHVPFDFASLLEPIAVCLEAVGRGRVTPEHSVLVVGDGPFGILIARLAAELRPKRLVLVGRHPFRLRQVPEAITVESQQTADVRAAVRQANGGQGLDIAIMAVGSQSALDLSLDSLRARGRAVVFSAIPGKATIDAFRLHVQELEIAGACNDQDLIDAALAKLSDPALRLGELITHHLPFSDWSRAFELARGRKDETLKVALHFPENR